MAAEHSFVADQLNWEQRVKSELESARSWEQSWGELFGGETTQEQRLKQLREELASIPGESLRTATMEYGNGKPFREVAQPDVTRKKEPDHGKLPS